MRHGNLDRGTALGLEELRRRLEADGNRVPPSILDETMNLATWNIREFGRRPRLPQSLHYIAEVIGRFDLVALTEVRRDLSDLLWVMELLPPARARRAHPGQRAGGAAVIRRGLPGSGSVPAGAGAGAEPAPALLAGVVESIVASRGGVRRDHCVARAAGPAKPAGIPLDLAAKPKHLPRSVAPRCFERRSRHFWRIKPLRIYDS